jgi:hypothetical protein
MPNFKGTHPEFSVYSRTNALKGNLDVFAFHGKKGITKKFVTEGAKKVNDFPWALNQAHQQVPSYCSKHADTCL